MQIKQTNKNKHSAITRDIYPNENAKETDEFHLNIQKCATSKHHKYSQNIHIAHFCQLKWMSTLQMRPSSMLPTAHHLILFINHVNVPSIDINDTQSIREELIVQCLLSMDCIDSLHLQRYCFPFDFCPNYPSLNALIGNEKTSNLYKEFLSQHPWISFANHLKKWCLSVLKALNLTTPNKSFLFRLTQSFNNRVKSNKNANIIDIAESNESDEQDVGGKYIEKEVIEPIEVEENANEIIEVAPEPISKALDTDHIDARHSYDDGLQLMQLSHSSTMADNDEIEEEDHDETSENVTNEKLPLSMPSLEAGSQQITESHIVSTQEDDYEDDKQQNEEFLDDLKHINNAKDQRGLFAVTKHTNSGSMPCSQTSQPSQS